MTTIDLLTKQLEESKAECTSLQKENELLEQKLAIYGEIETVGGGKPKTKEPAF